MLIQAAPSESGPAPHDHAIAFACAGGTWASKLDDLTDVSTAGATDGQVLKCSVGTWPPAPDNTGNGSGGASTLDQLDDVETSGATSRRALVFNGST